MIKIGSLLLLPPPVAAEKIGKSVSTLKRWRTKKCGPPVTKIGNDLYYEESGLERWIKSLEEGVAA